MSLARIDKWWPIFINELAKHGNVRQAAIVAGVNRATTYRARQRSPEIKRQWDDTVSSVYSELTTKQLIDNYQPKYQPKGRPRRGSFAKGTSGQLYVIREQWRGLVKIGITKNFVNRLSAIRSSCPQELDILFLGEFYRPRILEAELHERCSDYHYSGEWFDIPEQELDQLLTELRDRDYCKAEQLALEFLGEVDQ